jgi:NDP-sugar pyrophosphorylase family protein
MQILIPMAGAGSRFAAAGYDRPKPFIEFHGKTMIENVVDNLGKNNHYILVTQQSHYDSYRCVFDRIAKQCLGLQVSLLSQTSRGAAESCLSAGQLIDHELPVMIANCDQMMEWNPTDFKAWFLDSGLDGAIMTFDSQSPKNSYAAVNDLGLVTHTAEKQVISKHATNGIYVWKKAGDFIKAAQTMIDENRMQNGEFYVCPVYNENIAWGQKIGIYHIDGHWPIGTPQDLTAYLDHMVTTQ